MTNFSESQADSTDLLVGRQPPCVISDSDHRKVIYWSFTGLSRPVRVSVMLAALLACAVSAFFMGWELFWIPTVPILGFGVLVAWPFSPRQMFLVFLPDRVVERTAVAGKLTDRTVLLAPESRVELMRDAEDNQINGIRIFGAEEVFVLWLPVLRSASDWNWLHAELSDWIARHVSESPLPGLGRSDEFSPEDPSSLPAAASREFDFISTKLLVLEDSADRLLIQLKTTGAGRSAFILFFAVMLLFVVQAVAMNEVGFIDWLVRASLGLAAILVWIRGWIHWLDVEVSLTPTEFAVTRHLLLWPRRRVLSNGFICGARLAENLAGFVEGHEKSCVSLFGEYGAERCGSALKTPDKRWLIQRIRRFRGQDESLSLFAIEPSDLASGPIEWSAEELPDDAPLKLLSKTDDDVQLRLNLCDGRNSRIGFGILCSLGGAWFAIRSFHRMLVANAEWGSRLTDGVFGIGEAAVCLVGLFLLFGHIRVRIDRKQLSWRHSLGQLGWNRRVALTDVIDIRVEPLLSQQAQDSQQVQDTLWDRRCACRVVTGKQGFDITRLHSGAVATMLGTVLRNEVRRLRD